MEFLHTFIITLFLVAILLSYRSLIKTVQLDGFQCIHRIVQSSPQV